MKAKGRKINEGVTGVGEEVMSVPPSAICFNKKVL